MKMGELSEVINRNKSTTTALVKKLENLGFVQVEKSKEDSRKKIIALTEKGEKYNEVTAEISSELMKKAFKNFSEDEKQNLLNELLKLSENLN